jgi:carboxyl-terminal processing protease
MGVKRQLHRLGRLGLILLVLLIGLGSGVVLDRQVLTVYAAPNNIPPNATVNFQLIAQAWNIIRREYVDQAAAQPQQLTYGAISGMADALGDTGHSRFLTPEMVKAENNFTQGQFEGVGIEVQVKNNHLVVVAPIDGSPAQKAGLRSGDIILQVNGQDITGLPLDQVVSRILGPAGTQVTLTIQDPSSGQTRDVTLTRAKITLQNVTWQRIPGTTIADVRIAAFSQGVSAELHQALSDIQQQGMTGIILDLRDDPGGLLDESTGVASQFLSSGNVLLEKDVHGKITPVPVEHKYAVTTLPMVVLINNGTASAAEIATGALQDAHRAKLVGETTFGTGTVLNQFSLSDGSALLLATQEWLTPDGHTIWHKGITPDVTVALASNVSPVYPEAMKAMTATQLQASGDTQLLRALDLLNQPGAK